jgi:poly-gamma-glutamate capsule biosynthesis protein CapA/YwtB (metallophosphatase superfamily)
LTLGEERLGLRSLPTSRHSWKDKRMSAPFAQPRRTARLFLCGDVMTGRGIDQVLPHPCYPVLHETYVESAGDYVQLAEAANGPIPRPAAPAYIWGAALSELDRMRPDARIINLETSITRSEEFETKGINYRMSPDNAMCLNAAAVDCCVLANNHVLDWGRSGLTETLATLERLQIKRAGAGRDLADARAPAALNISGNNRVLVYSVACPSAGTPRGWAATSAHPGVNLLTDLCEKGAAQLAEDIARTRQPGDLVIVSVHWGPNWGYEIPETQRNFARVLIDRGGVSVIHGHSSHHPKAAEIYRDRLILYGCGDFLNDYEGIRGHEQYRDDLVLMYFADFAPVGTLAALEMVPLQIRNFRLVRPWKDDIRWMHQVLQREYGKFGAGVALCPQGRFTLSWKAAGEAA